MATNPSTLPENAGRITAPDANYPYGSAKNDSTGTTGDGTPIRKPLMDDTYGFYQALLTKAGIVPSGNAETALVSQLADAVRILGGGNRKVVVFSAAGVTNWTVPDEIKSGAVKPKVTLVGAGGGASKIAGTTGNGGGAGATAVKYLDLTGVTSVSITVGAAGVGKTGAAGVGTNGGTTSFGAYFTAGGGDGGAAANGRAAGGIVGTGTVTPDYGSAGQAGASSAGGGDGGSSLYGQGGRSGGIVGTATSTPGNAGYGAGAGGGAGANAGDGGNGFQGLVIIEW